MRTKAVSSFLLGLCLAAGAGCSSQPKAPDVKPSIEQALTQAGLKDVSVSQDRDKGVVTLVGSVASDAEKSQAMSIAQSAAGSEVVSNEIAVRPKGDESTARTVDSDLDKAIDKNLDAKLVELKLQHAVRYDVKNGVVTLKGNVTSQSQRAMVEKVTSGVPNVKQVVNELEVKNRKATTTNNG
ncbi:MAG TPA: BON domain-containing protein [Candidatus Binatia bacterium]|nr:BON domain-containing protein [Candidatus Binatia bacterium]